MVPYPSDFQQELNQRLRFEELLSDISARFISLPVAEIDSAIEAALQKICASLGFDISTLWQWSDAHHRLMSLTHFHGPPHGPKRPVAIDPAEVFPWSFQKLLRGITLVISTDNLPSEASRDQETRRNFGVKSAINIPLSAGGKPVIGVLTFGLLQQDLCWTVDDIKRLELVAQIFTNTLIRQQNEDSLRENEERFNLAADSAEAGIWELDWPSQLFWLTARARALFGYPVEEEISLARLVQSVHPDDRQLVHQAIAQSIESEAPVRVEYRVQLANGQQRWIFSRGRLFRDSHGKPVRLLGISADITGRKQLEGELRQRMAEIEGLKHQLENENSCLRHDLRVEQGFDQIIGASEAVQKMMQRAQQVAGTDTIVLINGEAGTGKGLLAHAIHGMSVRRNQALVTINCTKFAVRPNEDGGCECQTDGYNQAWATMAGRLRAADGGTIFFDHINQLSLELQVSLLRMLKEGTIDYPGRDEATPIDVRIIAASDRDLRKEVRNGLFSKDLFARLNIFPIMVIPLRNRSEDIPLLAEHFVGKICNRIGRDNLFISKAIIKKMQQYSWPGNIRELEHLLERSVIISTGPSLTLSGQLDIPGGSAPAAAADQSLATVERNHLSQVLAATSWKIDGPGGAAAILGLNPSTLRFKLKKHGIKRPS